MAYTSAMHPVRIPLVSWIVDHMRALAHAVGQMQEISARSRDIEHLLHMSDEALAARGLTRSEVVRHVFADLLGEAQPKSAQ